MTWMKPWMIGDGVAHEVEVARLLAYASTGGAEGIVTPGDLKVRPLSTPGTKVRVNPGAALMLNRFPGGSGQTYVGRLPIQEEVSVTATGSSGARSDLVVARIYDHQFAGQTPPDVQDFDYARTEIIEGVPSGTKSALELNLNYPAIALARLDLPASTGTIQASHVTDVREVAQPRRERHFFVYNLTVAADGTEILRSTAENGYAFPYNTKWTLDVPVWANRIRALGQWGGVRILGSGSNAFGRVWPRISRLGDSDGFNMQETSWDTADYSSNVREVWIGGEDRHVPVALRGKKNIAVYLVGRVLGSAGDSSLPRLDSLSTVSLDIEFYETAV